MDVDLSRLGPDGFERMCQALAVAVLGPGVTAFGDGPDGGREATFDGRLSAYPGQSEPWTGHGVVQAKHKARITGTGADVSWLRTQVKKELDAWSDPSARRVRDGRRPEYLIFATNVSLSAVPGRGGKDRIDELIRGYAAGLGLKDWRVWDSTQIVTYLNTHPQVRRAFAALITSSEVLAEMLDAMAAPPPPVEIVVPPVRIRPGQPGHEAAFETAYEAAGGSARLGDALGMVYEDGPGWVQHFAGGPGDEPAVLCALFGRPVAAVARSVWNDVCGIGAGGVNGRAAGVGYPVADPSGSLGFIGSDSEVVELAGGQWTRSGRSRLVYRRTGPPQWQPEIAFDREACHDRDAWTHLTDKRDLRVRVAARIPLFTEEWRIASAGRARLVAALGRCGLEAVLQRLAARLGLTNDASSWRELGEPHGHNNSRFAAYQMTVAGEGGRPALAACVYLVLPDGLTTAVHSTVDLRVDFAALEPALTVANPAEISAAHRLTLAELIDYFTHAWPTATNILPLAATADPLSLPPAGAPRLELYIQTERPGNHGEDRVVRTLDMVDLSDLGAPRHSDTQTLSIAVTTPLRLPNPQVEATVREALVRMAEDAGFAMTMPAGAAVPGPAKP